MRPLCDPWYSATSPLPKRPLPRASSSAKLLCGPNTCNLTVAWFPSTIRLNGTPYSPAGVACPLCCCLAVKTCIAISKVYGNWYAFDETPSYSIKPFLFELGIKLAQGMSYPLGALCLGNLYIHLNRLHDDEVEGSPYHVVESSVNITLFQVFVMEHLRTFAGHAKTSKAVQDRVLRSLGDGKGFLSKFSGGFPILFKWVGVKASEVSWMDDLDDEVKFVWQAYVKVKEGFACPDIFPATPFRDGYSSCFFKDGNLKFFRRQFGLDQDVQNANVVVYDCDTVMAPFIIIQASKYWSDLSVRVTIPAGKVMACDSADLRKSKPVVLAICAAPVGSDVIASSPIVIDEGPSDPVSEALPSPSTSEGKVYIPEVIERDDSSNISDILDHDDTSIQEVPLSMAPPATADIPESAAHFQENDLNMLPQIDTVDVAMDEETNSGGPHIDQATTIQPWDIASSSIPSQANIFTTAIVEKVTDNTRSSEVDLAIQRCGETSHGVSSPLVVGVSALGNTHPCHLNLGSAHSLAVNIVERDAPVSIVDKNDFDLIQGDFGSFLSSLNKTQANLRIASDFWSFSEAKENFLHFSVPAEATPLLEKLLLKHGNFMGGFKLGIGFGDFSLALLATVLMDIHHTPFDLLDEGKLFEWMDAVRDLMTTGVAIGFSWTIFIAKMEEELLTLKSEWEQFRATVPSMPAADMPLSNGLL
uniref:Aminotransferase-like plant mobile domain-containing protein n=1 Tax=Fagus sylvatica TaxID=28930 RepID=A0A2N9J335_FAGSY